ncbi:putative 4-hydroxy-4-methyl-2-oxoglutarate aldolase [Aeromonas salmonicida subsp. achromogenes]|uniref:putative 4-hydroxy-4-methyl-2-oxoglutarate aldolase n=1 Tax=Aeromonas salmonicida TaxID=645 RepID=UPI00054ED436|nr:putative 4-hydroxy-4-methyl-2-oxoglutarate aldolase [Aeromonas salmonicida]TMX11587.1 putative 4-hydroxy-4-methyl-2-oxoglutarate aldolase [Aeromonas salmonicida subsp. achromogenes]TMX14755.1 putative 4-hydroxy-4-methyl-2-oxoglutarate aldolase [Aeromonas salmonicida subsp. achromogenes]TMX15081.1 putative 4-hydroxy-4-methyl-2-oxoglutarate aldolase [Aeromonas salmonicida subsp. achromogenes]TMX20163.1 putative 4-hydroxy-4-methyl-2-oxoglutarate aldolase [Aeromonas salmonicida subsp. achromogen
MLDLLPDLCDQHGDALQVADPLFHDFGGKPLFYGQAVTLSCYEDNSLVRELVNRPGQGRVMVIDGGGSLRRALLGDQLAIKAAEQGWEGIVIFGAVRDVGTLATLALGVKALAACPVKTEKLGQGELDAVVSFAGVTIHPGDYVYADLNGVQVSATRLI